MGYLEIVCLGQVRPLKAGQVRPIAKLVPHLHKLFAVRLKQDQIGILK